MADSSTPFTTFGELLRHLRRRARMTQRDLGLAVGYSEAQIARLESGLRLPDLVAVKGAFVKALDLNREPAIAAQLVTLAELARDETARATASAAQSDTQARSSRTIGNLPSPATSLLGRKQDIVAVSQHITSGLAPLVTLVGPGGVGKTRLALEVARHLQDDYADGVWWVPLAAMTEPQAALNTIVQTLAIEDRPGKPALQVLQDDLRDKQLLFVLDNLEQVLEVAPLIGHMLSAAPRVKVLATSRELLRIGGEQVYAVAPLTDDAAALFVQRAKAMQPDFAVTEANRDAIAAICRKLDGLPLAIELAAARIPLFTPAEMLTLLDQRLPLLTGGARDVPVRHRALRATIEWSYNLLTPDEQALFRRLGVFAGGCTLHAVQTFCEADGLQLNAMDGLAALMAKNLLIREEYTIDFTSGNQGYYRSVVSSEAHNPSPTVLQMSGSFSRYRMLETIREYARDALIARNEYDGWMRKLADYLIFLDTLAQRPLPEEHDNWLTALQWLILICDATDLALRLATHGDIFAIISSEVAEWLERSLKGTGISSNPEPRMRARVSYAASASDRGKNTEAIEMLTEVLDWYEAQGIQDTWLQTILYHLGLRYREMGQVEPARRYVKWALQRAQALNQDSYVVNLMVTLAEVEIVAENDVEADQLLDQVIVAQAKPKATSPATASDSVSGESSEIDEMLLLAWVHNHRAHASLLRGETREAEIYLEQSLQSFARSPYLNGFGRAEGHESLGEAALMRGDAAQATEQFAKSLALFNRLGLYAGLSWALCGLAGALTLDEDPEQGARLWGAGEGLRARIQSRIAPASRQNRERTLSRLREQLSEADFARLTAEGGAWTLDQALEVASQI